jgi:molybdate transport system substrate-binding protein
MTHPNPKRLRGAAALALVLAAAVGSWAAARAGEPTRTLTVFEAASLKDAFAHLARSFEAEHPGVEVVVNAAGSQELRAQIEHGAPADVFASADRKHMDALAAQHLVGVPATFTCNEPVIVVRAGLTTPASLADLPRVARIVVATPEVPIGRYTVEILDKAARKLGADFPKRVEERIVSRELNVRQVLAKVVLGEADVGVVYRSDALGVGPRVRVVDIPRDLNVTAEYPIAALAGAPQPELARRFIELVRSPAGVAALRDAGFVPCPAR